MLTPAPRQPLWLQLILVIVLAALVQGTGLVYAYITRCKPGQGNDFCGAGSLAGVVFGFVAAVIVLIAGLVVVFLRRKKAGGTRTGAARVVAAVFGTIVLVPCVWMIAGGWPRNNSNIILWVASAAGLGLIAAAFVRKRAA